ncbi:unnamed protein product [Protopolystoma xenopodis]|uniref:Uncharacterized protein n=1 Tax=Protopolystoma xenopodis TaxID=117903 RepID=A0A3S5FDV1_9PLAT|nr:unnamed protein product [Protopolystoma xenopodis]
MAPQASDVVDTSRPSTGSGPAGCVRRIYLLRPSQLPSHKSTPTVIRQLKLASSQSATTSSSMALQAWVETDHPERTPLIADAIPSTQATGCTLSAQYSLSY